MTMRIAGHFTWKMKPLHQSPDIEAPILVRLQSGYAGWLDWQQAEGYTLSAGEGHIPSVVQG